MKGAHPSLTVVIPVYNEAANITDALSSLHKAIPVSYEVLIVYDNENDSTLPVLKQLKKHNRNLIVVKNSVCPGPSGAIRTGFSRARAPRILVTMADLCDDTRQIKTLLRLVPSKADIACPSRYSMGGKQLLKPSLKVWAPQAAGYLLRFITGIKTSDPTNSFKLYTTQLIRSINLQSTQSFSVTLEIVAKAHCLGYRIIEIPTVWHDRQHGKTNFKLGKSLLYYSPWFCLALLRNRLFHLPRSWMRSIFAM